MSLLWLLGVIGLVISIILFFTVMPSAHVRAGVDRSEARNIAARFLETIGVGELDPMAGLEYLDTNPAVFLFLDEHTESWEALEEGQAALGYGSWVFEWEAGGLLDPRGDHYRVDVSLDGRVISFQRDLVGRTESEDPGEDRIFGEAKRILDAAGIDPSSWNLVDNYTSRSGDQVESRLIYEFGEEGLAPLRLTVMLTGGTVTSFAMRPGIPERYEQQIRRRTQLISLFKGMPTTIVSFLIMVVLAIIFLKRYHQGEVGLRNGARLFWVYVVLSALVLIGILPLIAKDVGIPMFNMTQKLVFMGVLMLAFFIFGGAIIVFMGFCSGESYAREGWSGVLEAVDSLMAGRIFTGSFGRSVHIGFLCGGALLGFCTLVHWASQPIAGYRLPTGFAGWSYRWPFVVLLLGNFSGAIFTEAAIRFPFLALGRRLTRERPWVGLSAAALFSSLLFLLFADVPLPEPFWLMIPFSITLGVLSCLVFIRYGMMASFWCTFLYTGLLSAGPLLTSGLTSLESAGLATVAGIGIPVPLAVFAFRRRQPEAVHTDLLPPHIRRITERERLQKEMEIARHVQMKLLPKESPHLPGYDIAGACIPATEVGGDYFDFIMLQDGKVGIAVGDVSGKGVSAAIYMTLTKGILQSHVGFETSPVTVLEKVNRLMYRTIEKGVFVSLFYAVLDTRDRQLVFSRAGHNPGFLLKPGSGQFESLHPPGMALGLDEGKIFTRVIAENRMTLTTGDVLVFYTDGITEAMNVREEEYGEQRLMDCIARTSRLSSQEMVVQITDDVMRFAGEQPQHDDITIVVMKVVE